MTFRNFVKLSFAALMIYDVLKPETTGMNGPKCGNRVKCPGLLKNGQLKKGYRYLKGGKIEKVK